MQRKRAQAITGDLVTLSHPTLGFESRFSSYFSVLFGGHSYHLVSKPPTGRPDSSMTTGEYRVDGFTVRVSERIDQMKMGAAGIVYQNLLVGSSGFITVDTHGYHSEGAELLGAFTKTDTDLGLRLDMGPGVRLLMAPMVTIEVRPLGLLSISPLTEQVLAELPEWEGTRVDGGELFAGNVSRTIPTMSLVTDSARVSIGFFDGTDLDEAATLASQLRVEWVPPAR